MTQPSSEKINDNTSFQAFVPAVSRWLAWQCEMISEVKIGTVFLRSNTANNNLKMFASWPENVSDSIEGKLYDLAQDVIDGKNNIMPKMTCDAGQGNMVYDTTTLPLHYNNKVVGAVIFLQSVRSEDQKKAVFQLFQWGCALLESTLTDMYEEQHKFHPLVTDLAKLALQDAPVALIGHQICNLLAQQLGCKRVVLGTMQGLQVHTLALSNQLRFDTRASHISEMEAVMEEALDQDQAILYPKSEEMFSSVTQKHQTLSADNEDASLLTIPFSNAENAIGAILLLRPRNNPFTKEEVKAVQYATQLLGSALSLKLRDEYSFLNLLVQSLKKKTQPVFGTGHLKLKLSLLAGSLLLAILVLFKTNYYTYAKSSLEGAIQQVIVAPQRGFIETAGVRAGDKVESGQIMVTLNDHDLKLEHEKLRSERDKIDKEYREALALRERARVSILSAQIAQVDAQLDLVKEKLHRSRLKAPFSGVVVSGDLSQSLGAPVEKGEQLFEISPLGDYRVALSVDDHDISKLKIGQTGSLRLVGLPYDQLPITISRITPVATAQNGGNYFRVEATITDMNETPLRPGMQGVAKVQVGEDSVLWVWTHTLIEQLRLWFWSMGL